MKTKIIIIALVIAATAMQCRNNKKLFEVKKYFISPPIRNIDVKPDTFKVEAEAGCKIFYKTGSIINIPENAFLDSLGNLIKGEVKIKYRELHDPLDFFISGIPMTYDSNRTRYYFKSAGMIEINAYKDNKVIFPNPRNKIEIFLKTNSDETSFNFYYLDTIKKKWIYKGKDVVIKINNKNQSKKPLKPREADPRKKHIIINTNKMEFPELSVYKNVVFELSENNIKFNYEDSRILWNDLKINSGNSNGEYVLTFSNFDTIVKYSVYPAFEGKNYEYALRIYNNKFEQYQKLLKKRIRKEEKEIKDYEKKLNELNEKIKNEFKSAEKQKAEELKNILIAEKRQKMIELTIIQNEREIEKQKEREIKILNNQIEKNTANNTNCIYRTFVIEKFGIANCDMPLIIEGVKPIIAKFVDEKGNKIPITTINLVDKNSNMLYSQYSEKFSFNANSINIMWNVTPDGKLVYFTQDDFKKVNITSCEYTFVMRVYSKKLNSYEEIKNVLSL